MNKYKRLGKNTFLVFIGNTGSKLIALVMLPFYTSWLSVEDYGVTDIINVYVSFLVSIVSCCIAESIFIFPKGQKVEKQKAIFLFRYCFCIAGVFCFILIVWNCGCCFFHVWFFKQLYELSLVDIRFDGGNTFAAVFTAVYTQY